MAKINFINILSTKVSIQKPKGVSAREQTADTLGWQLQLVKCNKMLFITIIIEKKKSIWG